MQQGQPIYILKEGTTRDRGRSAQSNNIMAARAIADAVRSSLGPRGMDKMLVDSMGDVVITNDGATILREVDIQHPAAKMVVEVAKSQDQECGDGTTSAVVLAGELLKQAEDLIADVHPTLITKGYRMAQEHALSVLNTIGIKVTTTDDATLESIARTSMGSKAATTYADVLAPLVVKAVRAIAEPNGKAHFADVDSNIQIVKKQGGSVADTTLVAGIIVDKERVHTGMPSSVKKAKIALLNAAIEIKKTEVDAKIEITDPGQMQAFLDSEEQYLRNLVSKITASGANVVFCQKGIDDLAQHFLAKAGVVAVRRVKKSDMEKLELATGAKIVSNLDDLSAADLGSAGLVEERKIAEDSMTFVTECPKAKAVSVLIRGGTDHVIDEVERTLHDAFGTVSVALEDGVVVGGGGAPEVEVAMQLRRFATKTGGREQLAIEAFADAMEIIPKTLAENAGLDSIEILVDLRQAHEKGTVWAGVDVFGGKVSDMRKANVLEPLRVKTQAIKSATEVATMILRIDDVIASKAPPAAPKGGMGGDGDDYDF